MSSGPFFAIVRIHRDGHPAKTLFIRIFRHFKPLRTRAPKKIKNKKWKEKNKRHNPIEY